MRFGDVALPIIIASFVLIIILPIPNWLLDILLSINITVSLVILLNTLYTSEPLQFSIFPALLLLTTLLDYRLIFPQQKQYLSKEIRVK
jgi:flagellar biosynthesis protein FlhA